MPTLVLNAYSKAYPFITNRIKASVLSATSPYPVIASIIEVGTHSARVWSFPGLPRNNYGFSLDEIDSGGAVVNNLALFSVVPGEIDGLLTRNDEQPEVDVTVGFVSGTNTFTFDGTGGKPNYIGWEIVPSELAGRGILVRGLDYSWDLLTGIFTLLQPGDVFNAHQFYNIHFEPIQNPAGNSYPTITDFEIRLIGVDTILDDSYFGKKLICEPDANYMEVTLPPIATIPDGRRMLVEIGSASTSDIKCVKFIPNGSDVINWLRGNLYAIVGESFSIYVFSRPGLDREWRICEADGNFRSVGTLISDDEVQADVFGKQLLDGSIVNKDRFARIYNEVVLNLPGAQVCNFDDWATGNNKYLYSLANSSDPGELDNFHFPDRRNLFERNNLSGKAGDYQDDKIKQFFPGGMTAPTILDVTGYNTEIGVDNGAGTPDIKNPHYIDTGLFSTETRPKNYLTNKYVLL